MLKKLMGLLVIFLMLSGCSGNENIEKEETIEEVNASPINEGTIIIGNTENELTLNEEGYEGIHLVEYANQLPHLTARPKETATIHIDNDPQISVTLWEEEVPLNSTSFSLPYETGLYVYNIKAKWTDEEMTYMSVIEVPYEFKRVPRNKEPDNSNGWIPSPNGDKQVIIDGLGEFEANGTIVLKELSSNKMEDVDFNHGYQWTAKKIRWYDNESVLMTIGLVHGTVTRGGDLFHLNLSTLQLTPILELPVKEEVADFSMKDNQINYEVHVYEDDEMNRGHMETRTLDRTAIEEKLEQKSSIK